MPNACSRRCASFIDSCVNSRCFDTSPFAADDNKGRILAIVKRLLLGLVISAASGVGLYYLSMARPSVLFLTSTMHKAGIASAVISGTACLIPTLYFVHSAWDSYGDNAHKNDLRPLSDEDFEIEE